MWPRRSTTETNLTGLDKKYADEDKLVFFGVLAFRGEPLPQSLMRQRPL